MDTTLQPVHRTEEGLFNSASNIKVSLHNPTEEMINIDDIASSLSKICRFGGNIPEFYSVAQHTLLVVELAPQMLKKAAMLHDAPEAYLGDVIKPLKHLIKDLYTPLEDKFERLIFKKYGVSPHDMGLIKQYDMQALTIEHEYLRGIDKTKFEEYSKKLCNGATSEMCWNPFYAKRMFLKEFERLFGSKSGGF